MVFKANTDQLISTEQLWSGLARECGVSGTLGGCWRPDMMSGAWLPLSTLRPISR